jgi:RNA polymerase sigma-70 factor, ECF subfamily
VELSGATVLLKGPCTLIGSPYERTVVHRVHAPALATAGSGDVLAGVAGALCTLLPCYTAAQVSAYVHAQAAALWQQAHHAADRGLLAHEVADGVPRVLAELTQPRPTLPSWQRRSGWRSHKNLLKSCDFTGNSSFPGVGTILGMDLCQEVLMTALAIHSTLTLAPSTTSTASNGSPTGTSEVRSALGRHLPSLRAHAQSLCRNRDRADDLVQSTILRALRFEDTFRADSNLRAWLHQILMSVFVGVYRKDVRERRALARFGADPCSWVHEPKGAQGQAVSARVGKALGQLPAPFAEVVCAVDLQGQGYQETASAVGIPLGTVMSRLFRGRRLLRLALHEPAMNDTELTPKAAWAVT